VTRRDTGILGEALAGRYLHERGYQIIDRNYRTREGEVDIVATKDDCLIFFEVRTKRSRAFGTPEESITTKKMEHLRAAAHKYIETHVNLPQSWRIDVFCIELDKQDHLERMEVIESAIEDD
jgi:putative endonuclease